MNLQLPYPPSVNRIWRNTPKGTLKSSAYRVWLTTALALLRAQGAPKHVGSFRATIVVTRPDKRRRDIDNLPKVILDALTQAGVIEDDHLAQSVTVAWSWDTITPGGAVSVTIEPAEFPIFLMGRAA